MIGKIYELFFINIFLTVFFIILSYKDLKEQYKILNFKKIVYSIILFIVSAIIVTFSVKKLMDLINIEITSNQETIENYIKNGNALLMFLSCVILAPIYEELLFRNILSKFIKNNFIFILLSVILFSLVHISNNIIEFFPYFIYSLTICLIFIFYKRNIYSTIGFHMINNLIAFLLIII